MSEQIVRAFREAYTQSLITALDHGTTVVVPSQIVAESWRRLLLLDGRFRVLRDNAIISWDRFKEEAFDLRTERLPANQTFRALFARQLLRENSSQAFLSRLVPPRFAHEAAGFGNRIVRLLPSLPRARTLAEHTTSNGWLGPILDDCRAIEDRYRRFLAGFGLFEPAWLERKPAFLGGDYLLVMPELTSDFAEFEPALAAVPQARVPADDLPTLLVFPNTQLELETLFERLAELLDSGTPPHEIVITAADLEHLRPRLNELALLSEIPLAFRQGTPLSQSGVGRFFAGIAEVGSSGWELSALKRLLLNRAVPWLDYHRHAETVARAVRAGLLGGSRDVERSWRRLALETPHLSSLLDGIAALLAASSARELRSRLITLLQSVVDRDGWGEEEPVLQRSLEELRLLAEFEERHDVRIEEPYEFWLNRLGEMLYVPRSKSGGISVLPYRVGAGLFPEHHFVVNAHAAATRVREDRFPFLTDAQRASLGDITPDRDLTHLYAHAYSHSGEHVHLSHGAATWEGPVLSPGPFVAAGTTSNVAGGLTPLGPWQAEERMNGVPARIYRLQRDGATAYLATARRSGVDLTRSPIEDAGLARTAAATQLHVARPDMLTVSSASLHAFETCRFGFLLERVLGIRELELQVDPDSALELGQLYHDTLEAFFRELHEQGAAYEPSQASAYVDRLTNLFRELAERRRGMVPRAGFLARIPLARRVFERVVAQDSDLIAGHEAKLVEKWESVPDQELGAVLVGRMDRVTVAPDGTMTLVDYKKKTLPAINSQNGRSISARGIGSADEAARKADQDSIKEYQLPLYTWLLESLGNDVATAAFYSLEEGKARPVVGDGTLGKSVMERDRLDEVVHHLRGKIAQFTEAIRSGDYTCDDDCPGCPFRGICRTRFVVRP